MTEPAHGTQPAAGDVPLLPVPDTAPARTAVGRWMRAGHTGQRPQERDDGEQAIHATSIVHR